MLIAAVAAAAVATTVAVAVGSTAGAAGSTIVGVGSGRCLDVVGNARTARTPVNIDLATEQVLVSGILRNKFNDGGRLRFGPQGLAFDSQGRLWEQEFGNSVMDETNLIARGGNYGWPACEGTAGTCGTPGFVAPKQTYPTADGSCSGIAIIRDVLYVACERGTRPYREVIGGSSLTNLQVFLNGTYGRLRTVEPALDGGLWLTTSTTGDKDSIPDNSNEKLLHVALG